MIKITEEQIDRIELILKGIKNGPNKAVYSVINRGLGTIRTESSRAIRETYNVKQKDINSNSNIKVKKANSNELAGQVEFAGNLIPLIKFNPKDRRPNGVSVSVLKGWSNLISDAYIADLGQYGVGVFARETNKRNSSKQLEGPSAAHMMENVDVLEKVEKAAQETINKRVEHEITRLLNGY